MRAPPDDLGPGRHNPMYGMFTDEIILTGSGGPCILGLTDEEAEEARRRYDLQRERQGSIRVS